MNGGSSILLSCLLLCFQVCWTNPSETVEGEPLTNLDSISIYIGESSGTYDYRIVTVPETDPGVDSCTNIKVAPGDYFVAATATDSEGVSSDLSNEIQVTEERGLPTPEGGRLETPTGGRLITDG